MKQQLHNVTNLQLGFQFGEPSAVHTRQLSSFQYLAALYNDACQWDSGKPEWQRNYLGQNVQKGEYYAGTNGKSSMPVGWRRRKSNR